MSLHRKVFYSHQHVPNWNEQLKKQQNNKKKKPLGSICVEVLGEVTKRRIPGGWINEEAVPRYEHHKHPWVSMLEEGVRVHGTSLLPRQFKKDTVFFSVFLKP